MTARIKTQTIAFLLTVILTCMCLLVVVPKTAFAQSVDSSNAYNGISVPSSVNLHSQTKRTTSLDEMPSITVFTHGMSSSFQHWGGIYVGNNQFDHFDINSLPMKLNAKLNGDATIYVARSFNNYDVDYDQNVYCTINDVDYYPHYETSVGFAIQQVNNDGALGNYLTGDQRISFSNHTIIIFEEHKLLNEEGKIVNEPNIEISLRYKQLHDIIDKLLYEYNDIYGVIPRINLVGHSRGGLLNMMYANEHPYNVDSMYSFGSPYNGSLPSQMLNLFMPKNNIIGSQVDVYDINTKTAELKNQWNSGVSSTVRFKTLTATFDFNFIIALLLSDSMYNFFTKENASEFIDLLDNVLAVLRFAEASEIADAVRNLYGRIATPFLPFLGTLILSVMGIVCASKVSEVISGIEDIKKKVGAEGEVDKCLQMLARVLYDVREYGQSLISTFIKVLLGENFISSEVLGDMLVQLNSQRANGYSGATNLYHENYTASIYNDQNGLYYLGQGASDDELNLLSSKNDPAVPHNLECRNPRMIDAVLGDIRVGQPVCYHKNCNNVSISNTQHKTNCYVCGESFVTKHRLKAKSEDAWGHYNECLDCFFRTELESHQPFYNSLKGKCLRCGYTGPIPIIKFNLINLEMVDNYELDCSSR